MALWTGKLILFGVFVISVMLLLGCIARLWRQGLCSFGFPEENEGPLCPQVAPDGAVTIRYDDGPRPQ